MIPTAFKRTLLSSLFFLLVLNCSSSEEKKTEEPKDPAPVVESRSLENIEMAEPAKPEEDLSKKVGCIEGDCVNGIGKYRYENGDVYSGSFVEDKRSGKGSFLYSDGESFKGDYKEDQREGLGEYIFKNGDKYSGEFKAGQINGKGVYTFQDGKVLNGSFKEGADGEGSLMDGGKTRPCKVQARKLVCD